MQACVLEYASCKRLCKTQCRHGRRWQRVSASLERAQDAQPILLYVRSSISSATRVHFAVDLPIDVHLLCMVRCANQKILNFAHARRKKTKHSFVRHAPGERFPLLLCIRQAPFAYTVTSPSLPCFVQVTSSTISAWSCDVYTATVLAQGE